MHIEQLWSSGRAEGAVKQLTVECNGNL